MKIHRYKSDGVIPTEVKGLTAIERDLPKRWFGYSSIELLEQRGHGHEIDLVVVTHERVILIDLKDWHGKVSASRDQWLHNGKSHRSPVIKLAEAARKLKSRLERRLADRRSTPWVDYLVVFSGDCDREGLSCDEAHFTMELDDFCKLGDDERYNDVFPDQRRRDHLWKIKSQLDSFFLGRDFKASERRFEGYRARGDAIFTHPKNLFKEYRAEDVSDKNYSALLRLWDLDELPPHRRTNEERERLATREKTAAGFLGKTLPPQIADGLSLRLRVADPTRPVPTGYFELYELARDQRRLDEYLQSRTRRLNRRVRLELMRVLLGKFVALHQVKFAHRDIGDHCVWVQEPNLVSLSGFATARFPDLETIADDRELLAASRATHPEDILSLGEQDPFRRDVFDMAVTLARIAYEVPLPRKNNVTELPPSDVIPVIGGEHRIWLEQALDADPAARPKDALGLLERFEAALPEPEPEIDFEELDRYRSDCIPYLSYPPSGDMVGGHSARYVSAAEGGVSVKVWNGVSAERLVGSQLLLIAFLRAASEIKRRPVPGIAKVVDFGLGPTGLFLVTEFGLGAPLNVSGGDQFARDPAALVAFLRRLVRSFVTLHDRDIAHGDLKPEHVIVSSDDGSTVPFVIDALDYSSAGELANTMYCPAHSPGASAPERDCFAIAKMATELLAPLLTQSAAPAIRELHDALSKRIARDAPPLTSATELAKILEPAVIDERPICHVDSSGKGVHDHEFESDGEIAIITFQRQGPRLRAGIHGIAESIKFDWEPGAAEIRAVYADPLLEHQRQAITRSGIRVTLPVRIRVRKKPLPGVAADLLAIVESAYVDHLAREIEAGGSAAPPGTPSTSRRDTPSAESVADGPSSAAPEEVRSAESLPQATLDSDTPSPLAAHYVSPRRAWPALVAAEEEVLPHITVSGEPRVQRDRLMIPYDEPSRPLDYDGEEVTVFRRVKDRDDWELGKLDLARCKKSLLALETRGKCRVIVGQKLVFRASRDHQSFRKRRHAVARVVAGRAQIPSLISYFDPNASAQVEQYDIPVDEATLRSYKLNEGQRNAFRRVLRIGPVGLLQGPPGTGKTRFIGALVDFLLRERHAQNILFVGQSHVAVNTGAEKILEFLDDTDFDGLTRIGNPSALSDRLVPYHPDRLRLSYREKFRANMQNRIAQMSEALSAPQDFVAEVADIYFDLWPLASQIDSDDVQGDRAAASWRTLATLKYQADADIPPRDLIDWAVVRSASAHRVLSQDVVRRTNDLVKLSLGWVDCLATERGFDEFLARTRQVVCGTCVGVGRHKLGVTTGKFDWVIIDEAGRCDPGELAVPMQAAKRVLLVGDHRQLPPQHDKEVLAEAATKLGADGEALHGSDFERAFTSAYGTQVGVTLLDQYRMSPAICSLVSEFYVEPLRTARGPVAEWQKTLPAPLNADGVWLDTSTVRRSGETTVGKSQVNHAEIETIIEVLKSLVRRDEYWKKLVARADEEAPAVGVVCMYGAQKLALRDRIDKTSELRSARKEIRVDTVDAYQGRQNVIVIVSLVRNNPGRYPGFLRHPERVNVAFSRAQDKLIIVGAATMWRDDSARNRLARILKKMRGCAEPSELTVCDAKEFLK